MEEGREGEKERLSPINTDLIGGRCLLVVRVMVIELQDNHLIQVSLSVCFQYILTFPSLVLQSLSGAMGAE